MNLFYRKHNKSGFAPKCVLSPLWKPRSTVLTLAAFWVAFGGLLVPWIHGSSENTRVFLPKIQVPCENKSLWNEFIIQETWKSGFTPKTSIRLVNTMANSLFYQKPRIEYSSVRSFCTGRFDSIMEEEVGFDKKPCNVRGWFWGKSKICRFRGKSRSNPQSGMIKNDAMVNIYSLECLKPISSFKKTWKSRKWVKSDPKIYNSPYFP